MESNGIFAKKAKLFTKKESTIKLQILINLLVNMLSVTVSDPGFPVGGGRGPLTLALFGENVCKNERIGSHRGCVCPAHPPDLPMSNSTTFNLQLLPQTYFLCQYRKRTDIYYSTWSLENVSKSCQSQFFRPPPKQTLTIFRGV